MFGSRKTFNKENTTWRPRKIEYHIMQALLDDSFREIRTGTDFDLFIVDLAQARSKVDWVVSVRLKNNQWVQARLVTPIRGGKPQPGPLRLEQKIVGTEKWIELKSDDLKWTK